jgi:hypothetical protein
MNIQVARMQSGNNLMATSELHPGDGSWVGWMTPFSSTIAIGGWIKRHPPYEVAGLADKHGIYAAEARP